MARKKTAPRTDPPEPTTNPEPTWSPRTKLILSGLAVVHLLAVFAAPWSMPQPSSQLARVVNEGFSPWTHALYMRHGYRFFAPDPGPSHLILYEVTTEDGRTVEGRFPDRNQHRPRLLYHRFFMISEHFWGLGISQTITAQQETEELQRAATYLRDNGMNLPADWILGNLPQADPQPPTDEQIRAIVEDLKRRGNHHAARTAERDLIEQRRGMERTQRHRQVWLAGMANYLKSTHNGTSVRIWIQEHLIPTYDHVLDGGELTDPRNYGPRQLVYSEDEVIE